MDRREFLQFLILTGSITFLGIDPGCGETKNSKQLKKELKIPPDAKKVLILSQSSHWDINWQKTFDEYYHENVKWIIKDSIAHLEFDNDNTYSISEIAFLKRYWNDYEKDREKLKLFYNQKRFQIVGGGYTSPDTLLPTTEMLLRDWMYGNLWVNENLGSFPDAAWQPDSFGHSGTLPDILSSLGYKYVGFSRIDGAPFYASSQIRDLMGKIGGRTSFLPNSHGKYFHDNGIALFWWIGPRGGKVLAYWMPYTYCQGDDIDSHLPFSLPGVKIDNPQDRQLIFERITQFINDLTPYSRNKRYMFVPVGCDFQKPHLHLAEYARWWNEEMYQKTGVYVVTATFRDFMTLSEEEKDIPVLRADLNPLWTGFYSYHPYIKESSTLITHKLILSEIANVALYSETGKSKQEEIEKIWEKGVLINHHDWIPGTSMPHVYYNEQLPDSRKWVQESHQLWQNILTSYINSSGNNPTLIVHNPFPFEVEYNGELDVTLNGKFKNLSYRDEKNSITVFPEATDENGYVTKGKAFLNLFIPPGGISLFPLKEIAIDKSPFVVYGDYGDYIEVRTGYIDLLKIEKATGNITELSIHGEHFIYGGKGNSILFYNDIGGPYGMGMEGSSSSYHPIDFEMKAPAEFSVLDYQPFRWGVEWKAQYENFYVKKTLWIFPSSPLIEFETEVEPIGNLPDHVAWVIRFETTLSGKDFLAHLPGGIYKRKRKGLFNPTYWPIEGWLKISDSSTSKEILFSSPGNRAWRVDEDGVVETVILRNAYLEEFANFGAWCDERNGYKSRYILFPGYPLSSDELIRYGFYYEYSPAVFLENLATSGETSLFELSDKRFLVSALYRSTKHRGFVIRIYNPLHIETNITVKLYLKGNFQTYRINGREEKIKSLGKTTGEFQMQIKNTFETILLEEI